jgi:MFS family permease
MTEDYTTAGKLDSIAGWFVALSAFIAGFVAFGVMYSFGAFFTSMEAEFHASRTATSAFFAATGMLFYFFGSITGRLSDRFGPRRIVLAGAVIMGTGLTLTAAAPRMWTGYLTYGVGAGIGASCAYIPTLALVGGWFTRHRTTALGLAAAGTGCGTLLMPPVAAALIQAHGWRTAYVLFAASSFILLLICACLARPSPLVQRHQMTMELRDIVRSRPFALLYASWVLATTGLIMAMVFLVPFAHDVGRWAGCRLRADLHHWRHEHSRTRRDWFHQPEGRSGAALQIVGANNGGELPVVAAFQRLWLAGRLRRDVRIWLRGADRADARGIDRVFRPRESWHDAGRVFHRLRYFSRMRTAGRRLDHRLDRQLSMGRCIRARNGRSGLHRGRTITARTLGCCFDALIPAFMCLGALGWEHVGRICDHGRTSFDRAVLFSLRFRLWRLSVQF